MRLLPSDTSAKFLGSWFSLIYPKNELFKCWFPGSIKNNNATHVNEFCNMDTEY